MTRRTNWFLALVGAFLAASIALGVALPVPAQTKKVTAVATVTPAPSAYDATAPQNLTVDDIKGEAAIVMDASTGRVLFEKNADEKLYPASTTKVMTCLLALEHGHLDDVVTIPTEISKVPAGSSLVPLKVGETMTFRDLLYGTMLRSGNDGAIAIAVLVAGSVDKFVDMMNQKAQELGCQNTHFANPHGFQDVSHYSTARDLARITREALKDATFRQIVSAESHVIPANNKGKQRVVANTDAMLNKESDYYYPYEIGVKSGYHSQAGQCFVGAAQKDGATLVSVTLKSTKAGKWNDTRRLMEYGFTRYQHYTFQDLYALSPLKADVEGADASEGPLELKLVPGGSIDDYGVQCIPDDLATVAGALSGRVTVQYNRSLTAPIRAGDALGTITFTRDDGTTLTGTVAAGRDVAAAVPTPSPTPIPTPTPAPTPAATLEAAAVTSAQGDATPAPGDMAASVQAEGAEGAPAPRKGELAPWSGSTDLMLLFGLMGLFVLVLFTVAGLRIHYALRRRRYRKLCRRRDAGARPVR